MAIHIIPEHEKDKHTESPDCACEPEFLLDEETGEMVWAHQILDYDSLLGSLIDLGPSLILFAIFYS
jgi:hypothetical protein